MIYWLTIRFGIKVSEGKGDRLPLLPLEEQLQHLSIQQFDLFISRPHLQSMFLLMNSVGIDLINATLSCDVAHRTAAIFGPHGEINLSRNVLQQGYNLGALQRIWRGRNFRNGSAMTQMCTLMKNDPYSPKKDRDPLTLEVKDGTLFVDLLSCIFRQMLKSIH